MGAQKIGDLVEVGRIGVGVGLGEIQMVHAIDGYDVDVNMGDFETGHQEADSTGGEGRLLGDSDSVGDAH